MKIYTKNNSLDTRIFALLLLLYFVLRTYQQNSLLQPLTFLFHLYGQVRSVLKASVFSTLENIAYVSVFLVRVIPYRNVRFTNNQYPSSKIEEERIQILINKWYIFFRHYPHKPPLPRCVTSAKQWEYDTRTEGKSILPGNR